MVFSAKLGIAIAVALASNASLFSVLLYPKGSSSTPSTTTSAVFPATTASTNADSSTSSRTYRDAEFSEAAVRTDSHSSEKPTDYTTTLPPKKVSKEDKSFPVSSHGKTTQESYVGGVSYGANLSELDERNSDGTTFHPPPSVDGIPEQGFDQSWDQKSDIEPKKQFTTKTVTRNTESPHPESEQQDVAPAPGKVEELKPQEISINSVNEAKHLEKKKDGQRAESRQVSDPAVRKPKSQTAAENILESGTTPNLDVNPKLGGKDTKVLRDGYEQTKVRHTTTTSTAPAQNPKLLPKYRNPKGDVSGSFVQQNHPRFQQRDAFDGWDPRRGDVPPDVMRPSTPPPSHAGLGSVSVNSDPEDDPEDGLYSLISTLTDRELMQLDPAIVQVLIPALRSLEAVVIRELRTLRDVTQHQEQRLQRLEESQPKRSELAEAVKVIREEKRRIQMLNSPDQPPVQSLAQSGNQSSNASASNAEADDHLGLADDNSGSGEEEIVVVLRTTVEVTTTMTMPTTTTPTRANTTERNDEMIINHIYDMYNSLSSMENKVNDLGTRLRSLADDVYRQRTKHVPLEDKMAELGRGQKSLLMRSTMHQVSLSDLEQFKNKAEAVLGPAENRVDHLDSRLEIFTDRMMEQQDEVAIMNDVYTRLEQMSQELRSSDGFKAHDVVELKRGYQQIENRLTNLQTTLDHAMDNIRYELKIQLDNMCANNRLQC